MKTPEVREKCSSEYHGYTCRGLIDHGGKHWAHGELPVIITWTNDDAMWDTRNQRVLGAGVTDEAITSE